MEIYPTCHRHSAGRHAQESLHRGVFDELRPGADDGDDFHLVMGSVLLPVDGLFLFQRHAWDEVKIMVCPMD